MPSKVMVAFASAPAAVAAKNDGAEWDGTILASVPFGDEFLVRFRYYGAECLTFIRSAAHAKATGATTGTIRPGARLTKVPVDAIKALMANPKALADVLK